MNWRSAIALASTLLCSGFGLSGVAVAQQTGTAAEAKTMLQKAVTELKADQAAAISKFNKPDGGFRDRDLYVYCFEMGSGKFTAHANPALMGTRESPQGKGRLSVGSESLRRSQRRNAHDD